MAIRESPELSNSRVRQYCKHGNEGTHMKWLYVKNQNCPTPELDSTTHNCPTPELDSIVKMAINMLVAEPHGLRSCSSVCGRISDDLPAPRSTKVQPQAGKSYVKEEKIFTRSASREVQPQASKSYMKVDN